MSINSADLTPYQEQLPQPVRRDLRKHGPVCHETVEIKHADNIRYSSQLPATSAWTYEGDVPGPLIIVDDSQTVHVEWRNAIEPAQTLPYQVVVFPNPAEGTRHRLQLAQRRIARHGQHRRAGPDRPRPA